MDKSSAPDRSAALAKELGLESSYIDLPDVRLHVVTAGPKDGPLLILLHGFPEFWYGWRSQISYFAGLGWRVLVPDQRGYNLSSKPAGVESYA
ncbi:MAG: alpha/beta fold hydrolase, partial [Anaerolineaceae bacterium]|nr:alpha/beta fold hydrolase [Anaerolineaceae bacterium]